MGIVTKHRLMAGLRTLAKRWEYSLCALLLGGLFASCDEESLVKINVTGDVSYTNVELRVLADGGSVQQSFLNATFGPVVIFKAGLYLPSNLTGIVTIEADAYRNKCLVGTKIVMVPKVISGQATAEVPIEVIGTGATCPVDGGGGGKSGGAGGSSGAGGKAGTGGTVGAGGHVGTGGQNGSGGVVGTGGAASGGSGTGGMKPGTGGTGSGGIGTGGDHGSGGRSGSGGRDGTGGREGRGGEGGLAVANGGRGGDGGRGGAGGRARGGRGGDLGNGGDEGAGGDGGGAGGRAASGRGGDGGRAAGGREGMGGIGVIVLPAFAESTSNVPLRMSMAMARRDSKAWTCTF